MFQPLLKEKFKYFTGFFENAFKNPQHKIPQSIILYGQDSLAQYYIAQDIARILNCKKDGACDCGCINCSWIRHNQHPAVLTYTRFDNRTSDKGSANKNISVVQVKELRNSLVVSSEYYRVFIFCDTDNREFSNMQKSHIADFEKTGFKLPYQEEGKDWYPRPLNRVVLPGASSNALLKSIEEPPERVLFVFLTDDKDSLLETIVSRSQCFYIPSFLNERYDTEFMQTLFENYPSINKAQVLNLAAEFVKNKDEKGYTMDYTLDCMQFYLKELIKSNLADRRLVYKLKNDILSVQEAKKQADSYIKPNLIIENLFFSIAQ